MSQTAVIQNSVLTGQALYLAIDKICQSYEIPAVVVGSHSPAYHFSNLPEPVARYEQPGREPVCFWPQFDWHVLFAKAMTEANNKLGFICVRPDERTAEIAGFQLTDAVLMIHFPSNMLKRLNGAACIEEPQSLYSFVQTVCARTPAPIVIVMSPGSLFGRKVLSAINDTIKSGFLIAHALGDTPSLFSKSMLAGLVKSPSFKDKLRLLKHSSLRIIKKNKEKQLYGKISHLWVPTDESQSHWQEFTNCPITLTSGGYDSDFWKPGSKIEARKILNLPCDVPVILSSSVLIPKKRLDDLIKASAIVREKLGNVCLILSGYGEESEKNRLLEIVRQTQMKNCVIFTDYVKDDELRTFYRAADVFVHLSAKEGGPTSCKQALATNIPVVMTPVGSVGKWIQESGMGRLFPVGDVSACAEQIIDTLQSENLPFTSDFAYKLWSWDARGKMMAADVEKLWQKAQVSCND